MEIKQPKKNCSNSKPSVSELTNGIAIEDENGNKIGYSKKMAKEGISLVVLSRILMAAPGMGMFFH